MKYALIAFALFLFSANVSAQGACGNVAAMPGKWVQDTPVGKDPVTVRNIKTVMSMFQKSVAGFTGGQARTYTFTSGWVDTRPYKFQSYTVALYLLQYECVAGKMKPEAATGTWLYIGINEIPFFNSNNNAEQSFKLPNGQQMFYSKLKLTNGFQGMTKISPLQHPDGEAVFLSNSNRLPFRQVSQADVLANYKKYFAGPRTSSIKSQEDILAREPGNARAKEIIAGYKNEISKCDSTIDMYLTKADSKKPAFVDGINSYCDPQNMFLNPSDERSKQVVVYDDAFFDKSLPGAAPQFIVVYWRKGDSNHQTRDGAFRFPVKREFIRKFEENFDFEALKKVLGK